MVRALTTLVGLAAAAAILYFVTDIGDNGGSYWTRALVWAAAGLVLGIFYQAGGHRSPGFRANTPMLLLAFLPWTVLSAALTPACASVTRACAAATGSSDVEVADVSSV